MNTTITTVMTIPAIFMPISNQVRS
jgi:hypothetical protein